PIDVNSDAGVCTYASSQLTAPTTSDNCNVASVVASPASLVSGSNTVTWTVTDDAGNTNTSTQIVTVLDAENPTIATLGPIDVNSDAGVCTYASSQLTAPTTSDNCNVASVVASPASLVSGANTVTWTVTDDSGNTNTSTQIVTVTKDNNIAVVDVTGTSDPETDGGIVNGSHCPDLNGLQAVVAPTPGYTYSAGTSRVQFRVDRLCNTGAWSFAYQINGANVDKLVLITDAGTPINASNVISLPSETNYVLFTIDVENEVNTVLPIDFKISDGGTESAIKDEITIQHNLKIIPLIGGFQ
ncbi:hypothetical protein, partial [Ancylomarina salipaludis]|uniref:hypothetical protein n=1 Tax=Ancylomarina salipaludis TaxID=2501299 RepID=UPI0019D6E4F2